MESDEPGVWPVVVLVRTVAEVPVAGALGCGLAIAALLADFGLAEVAVLVGVASLAMESLVILDVGRS